VIKAQISCSVFEFSGYLAATHQSEALALHQVRDLIAPALVNQNLLRADSLSLDGGREFVTNEAISFIILTEGQADTDRLGARSSETAAREACELGARTVGFFMADHPAGGAGSDNGLDRAAAKRAMNAMLTMKSDMPHLRPRVSVIGKHVCINLGRSQ
jgi:hypothetical protein